MFRSLATLISTLFGEARAVHAPARGDCSVAVAALLVRVASVDTDMSGARRAALHSALKHHFDRDDAAAAALVVEATEVSVAAIDLYRFTTQINARTNAEARSRIVQSMWEILLADASVSPLENNIVWRAADLLGVPSRERLVLRHRVAANRASTVCRAVPQVQQA